MALIPRLFFCAHRKNDGSFRRRHDERDPILAGSPQIQPASFRSLPVDGGGAGFEIGFNSEDEAHLFEEAFG